MLPIKSLLKLVKNFAAESMRAAGPPEEKLCPNPRTENVRDEDGKELTAHADLAGSRVAKIVCQQDRAKNRSARNHIDGGTNRHVYRCFPGSPLRRLASQKNEWAQSVIAQEKPFPNKHGLSVKRTWSPTRASGRRQPPLAAIMSSLKSLLKTGEPITFSAP